MNTLNTVSYTHLALFKDGEFLTQGILNEKKFLKYAGIDMQ